MDCVERVGPGTGLLHISPIGTAILAREIAAIDERKKIRRNPVLSLSANCLSSNAAKSFAPSDYPKKEQLTASLRQLNEEEYSFLTIDTHPGG